MGLSSVRVSHIFPLNLRGYSLVLCFYDMTLGETLILQFRDSAGATILSLTINPTSVESVDSSQNMQIIDEKGKCIPGWQTQVAQIEPTVILMKPDKLDVFLKAESGDQYVGSLHFVHGQVAPYSSDQIAALRSGPLALKLVRASYSCNQCGRGLKTYAGIERNEALESEGWLWSLDLGEEFQCQCGKLSFSLQYLRTGLHGLLSRNLTPPELRAGDYIRLYETTKLEEDCRQFKKLLDKNVPEEELQNFLETHPVFLGRFSPTRILPKPPILTMYRADFGILNARKELLLLEIENANFRLIKKDGALTAKLQHAIAQVKNWIRQVDDHRSAALSCLGIELKEVAVVQGVVIAGRTPTDHEEARLLRGAFSGNVEFYTYDDLLKDTTALIRQVANV